MTNSNENSVPQFESDSEYFAWAFEQISKSIKNLADRQAILEQAIQKMPPPGADMVKYKIPCLLYTSPSPRDKRQSRMPSSA